MTGAVAHRGAPRRRALRLVRTDTAALAIGALTPGMELFCLTFGQFSLIDALQHLAREAGPCEVVVSTWTAAHADAERAAKMLDDGAVTRFRLLVDRSFVARQPAYCARVAELFGADAIRTAKSHAKFALVTTAKWHLVVRTSMNLNENPRLETIEISDDPGLHGFMIAVVESVWAATPPGATRCEDLPALAGLRIHDTPSPVRMGRVTF